MKFFFFFFFFFFRVLWKPIGICIRLLRKGEAVDLARAIASGAGMSWCLP